MINFKIDKRPLWFSVGAVVIFLFFLSSDVLAHFVWQKYHWPKTAILLDRSDADLAMLIGNYYFNGVIGGGAYNPDIAFKAYQKAVSINPKILWGHYQLARIYFVKGDFNGALSEINNELNANPENLRSLYIRGLIYGYRALPGDFKSAETDLKRFTKWTPKEWAGYNDLAWVLSKQGKYMEAEKTINQALKEVLDGSINPWLWNALGVAELNLKKYIGAADSFKKAENFAGKLTTNEWRMAYPGNSPESAESGLAAFKKAIEENLRRARQ